MPKRDPKLIVAETRVATARKVVGHQRALIQHLRLAGKQTDDDEKRLLTYESALAHLENHERIVREERREKKTETMKKAEKRRAK